MTPLNSTGGTRATISAQMCMDAGSDGTRAKRKQFAILLCPPMAPGCCCLYRGETSVGLRFMSTLWQETACL